MSLFIFNDKNNHDVLSNKKKSDNAKLRHENRDDTIKLNFSIQLTSLQRMNEWSLQLIDAQKLQHQGWGFGRLFGKFGGL